MTRRFPPPPQAPKEARSQALGIRVHQHSPAGRGEQLSDPFEDGVRIIDVLKYMAQDNKAKSGRRQVRCSKVPHPHRAATDQTRHIGRYRVQLESLNLPACSGQLDHEMTRPTPYVDRSSSSNLPWDELVQQPKERALS